MPLLTSQEKNITIFLLSTALIGSAIGVFRHNWLKTPEILLSPKNLPSNIKKIEEGNIIEKHNILIKERSLLPNRIVINSESQATIENSNINYKPVQNAITENVSNKTKSNKKRLHKIHQE